MNHILRRFVRRLASGSLILALVLPAAPSVAFAQTPMPPEPVIDTPLPEGQESVVVAEASETPTVLVGSGVSSFAAPSPGVFWLTESYCEPEPPSAAASETSAQDAASSDEVAPSAVEAATDFKLQRTNYAGMEYRLLQLRADSSGPPAWYCPNQYKVNSNVVADQTHVYWVDANGLVRVPVTANPSDAQEVIDGGWNADDRVDLKMVGNLLFGTINNDPTSGPFGTLGSSALAVYNTATGEKRTIKFNFAFNAEYNSPNYDGTYVYFKIGSTLTRINLDGSGEAPIASGVGVYSTQSRSFALCLIGQPCPHYLFYVISSGGTSVIYRHNFTDGQTAGIQTRNERTIHSLLSATVPGTGIQLPSSRIFWIESFYVPDCDTCFTGTTTFSLQRAALSGGAQISNLYNLVSTAPSPPQVGSLASNGQFMLWRQNNAVLRLANDAAALPVVNLRVTGIEVTQAVQDDANSVRLVRGRETWVRVFVKSDGGNVANVTMRLTSSAGGGSLYPNGAPFMTVKSSPDKNNINDSFLFLLPSAWWNVPTITFTASLNPHKLPFEPDYGDNVLTSPTLTMSQPYPMKLVLYTTTYSVPSGPNQVTPFDAPPTAEHFDRIRRTYPLAEGGLTAQVKTIAGGQELGLRVNQMHPACLLMNANDRSLCAAEWLMAEIFVSEIFPTFIPPAGVYHYGLINDALAFPRGRVLDVGYPIGAGPAGTTTDRGYYTAHEVGHMLGRNHPTPNSDDPNTNPAVEGCGHSRSDNAFPYAQALIGFGNGSIRGFDRASPAGGGSVTQAVLGDTVASDVMSYCGNAQLRWPSPYTWEGMYTWLRDHDAAQSVNAAEVLGGPMVALFGTVHGDTLSVLKAQRTDTGMVMGLTPGAPYALQLLDAGSAVLGTHTFAAEDEGEGATFALMAPWAAGTRTLRIVGPGDVVLWSQAVSANAPVVSAVALPGAPNPVDGEITLTWTASDPDGDALIFDVQYSNDGGLTWQPVTFALTGTSVAIDTTVLPGGTGRFRVVASDGVNGAYAESANVTVVNKAPTVQIMSPGANAVFSYGQTVGFSAVAVDVQDGLLEGAPIVWSNASGTLGTGSNLAINTLPTGENVITVTATNSKGLAATASVTIFVGDALEGPEAALVATPPVISVQVDAGATTAETRLLNLDYVGASGAIAWTASSSEPWLTLDVAAGASVPAAITLTVDPAGLAANRSHAATVTINATPAGGAAQTVIVPLTLAIGNTMYSASDSGALSQLYLPLIDR